MSATLIRSATVATLLASTVACGPTARPAADTSSVPGVASVEVSSPSAQPGPLAAEAVARIADLNRELTLGEWRTAHPNDSFEWYGPGKSEQANDKWCARALGSVSLDSARTARRTAYFYVPSTADSTVLPADTVAKNLAELCRFGLVKLEVAIADTQHLGALASQTRVDLGAALGPVSTAQVQWWGSAYWIRSGFWKPAGLSIVTAIDTGAHRGRDKSPGEPGRLMIMITGRASELTLEYLDWGPGLPEYEELQARQLRTRSDLEQAVERTGPDNDLARALGIYRTRFSTDSADVRPITGAERVAFVQALTRAVATSRSVAADRHAATLVAADELLSEALPFLTFDSKGFGELRTTLESAGATFDYSPLGESHVYSHAWLKKAIEIDRDGPAGGEAFLSLMARGFETSAACAEQKGKGFRAVIARGEERLRDSWGPPRRPRVHLMVAQAYADIVRLANGGAYQDFEQAEYTAEAPAARAAAIAHYRAAFNGPLSDHDRRNAWPPAWRMIAGLVPARTYFYCVYD